MQKVFPWLHEQMKPNPMKGVDWGKVYEELYTGSKFISFVDIPFSSIDFLFEEKKEKEEKVPSQTVFPSQIKRKGKSEKLKDTPIPSEEIDAPPPPPPPPMVNSKKSPKGNFYPHWDR